MRAALRVTVVALLAGATLMHAGRIELTPLVVTTGDPDGAPYLTPPGAGYAGVALLEIQSLEGERGCTGALLPGGMHVLTAAHCLTDVTGSVNVLSLTATFNADESTSEVIEGSYFIPHPEFTGALREGNDIAIVGLERAASPGVERHQIYTGSGELGSTYEVVGWGARGTGETGAVIHTSERRRGWNTFDATMTSTFGAFPGWTGGDRVLVSDFDNGNPANDALGRFYGIPHSGLALLEASMAPGDSGAPAFIGGRIAGVASFRLRLNFTDGSSSDIDDIFNASFGEFNAFTRVSSYRTWIQPVPEPGTAALCVVFLLVVVTRLSWKSPHHRSYK
jgi:secreted trypsin-like serine protease